MAGSCRLVDDGERAFRSGAAERGSAGAALADDAHADRQRRCGHANRGGGMTGGLRIDSAALSHEGRVRTNNEDAFCERPREGLWAVADGMGGHEHGEWASAAIADALTMV